MATIGRPSKRTDEIVDSICSQISEGITLSEICRQDGMPNRSTFYHWLNEDENLSQRFARARELGEDAIADETLEIADDSSNDWIERNKGEGFASELNSEHVQRSKLRIETRLKLLAKWNPKKWGDRMDVTSGGDKVGDRTMRVVIVKPTDNDDDS